MNGETQTFDEHPPMPTPLPLGRVELPATLFVGCSHPSPAPSASQTMVPTQTESKPSKEFRSVGVYNQLTLEQFLAALFSLTERYTEQTRSFVISYLSSARPEVLKALTQIGEAAQLLNMHHFCLIILTLA
jgi:hypothetical protein